MRPHKLYNRLREGHVANVRFRDLQTMTEAFGLTLVRIRGSHHIYAHPELPVMVNLQADRGYAKPYQIRQLLSLIKEYRLNPEENER